jgi:hypothetical protein
VELGEDADRPVAAVKVAGLLSSLWRRTIQTAEGDAPKKATKNPQKIKI